MENNSICSKNSSGTRTDTNPSSRLFTPETPQNNPEKLIKLSLKIKNKSIDQESQHSQCSSYFSKKSVTKKGKDGKLKLKRHMKEANYNCGRWQPEEHERFIEAIMKYGNEWKQVQRHVGTRSSTQARSHAQKFFVKMKRANVLDLKCDISKNSIKSLHEMAGTMSREQYTNAMKALNCVAFERKSLSLKRKLKKTQTQESVFAESHNMLTIK
jgi:SHAQKYF class myb-like DNA-binding protein